VYSFFKYPLFGLIHFSEFKIEITKPIEERTGPPP